jgi:ankyrin repeat protein
MGFRVSVVVWVVPTTSFRKPYSHSPTAKIFGEGIDHGSDIDARNKRGETPLFRALITGKRPPLALIELLLQRGADPNARDSAGQPPIFYAESSSDNTDGSLDILNLLILYGADATLRDNQGNTALFNNKSIKMLGAFLKLGVDVNAFNNDGQSALLCASGNKKVMKFLIDHGADVNIRDDKGSTALHIASTSEVGDVPSINCLLLYGADIEARDADGRTPLFFAAGSHFFRGVRALLKAGANVNARDNQGQTPFGLVLGGTYLGDNPYYAPEPMGEGNPVYYASNQKKMASLLQAVGGVV